MSAQLQPAAGEKPSWLFLTKPIYGLGLVHPANMTRPLSAVIVIVCTGNPIRVDDVMESPKLAK